MEKTKNILSRRQQIPPTPRDTMAVLMQAADQQLQSTSIFAPHLFRWVTGAAAILLIAVSAWYSFRPSLQKPEKVATFNSEVVVDAGIDLADWDMEFESLLSEFDDSLTNLAGDEYFGNGQIDSMLKN